MKRKGFTLVELLAVIVVLSIIAVIATPMVLNTIEESRQGAAMASATSYIKAIEEKVASAFTDDKIYEDKDEYIYDEIEVDIKGTTPTGGIYSLKDGNVSSGLFCIDGYKVKYIDGKTEIQGNCTGDDLKLDGSVKLSEYIGFYEFQTSGTVEVIENISGGKLSCTSSDEEVADCSISGTTVTVTYGKKEGTTNLTIKSEGTSKYKEAQVVYSVIPKGLLSVTADGYSGTYDGKEHGIVVSSENSIIRYGLEEGTYDLEQSPTYIDVGEYTVYYQVTRAGYTTVTGSKQVVISKAPGEIKLVSENGTVGYNETTTVEITKNKSNGEIVAEVANQNIVDVSVVDNKISIVGKQTGTTTIEVTSIGTNNYENASTVYTVTVVKANNTLTLSENKGSYTYPTTGTFTVTENTSGGKLSCETSDKEVADCIVEGTTVTVTPGTKEGSATLTIKSEETTNYNAGQAAYVAITAKGTLTSYTATGYNGTYDGTAHGIVVTSSGSTIKYGTVDGSYTLDESPKYTDVGEYTVYYQITTAGYNVVTGSRQVVITQAKGSVVAPTAKTLTYTGSQQALINAGSSNTGTIQYKLEGGEYSTNIPTATNDGTYKVYYRVIGDKNHKDVVEASITVTISKATLEYTANGYSGTYDGEVHGITVTSSGATIMYGTDSGVYPLNASPLFRNAGTYTVYYQITRTGYTTVTGYKTVVINKANNTLTLSANTATYTYPTTGTFTVTENTSGGALSCETNNSAVADCSISGTTITVTPGTTAGAATLTIKSEATTNYNVGQAAHVATTAAGLQSVTANGYSGTYDGAEHGITVTSSGATIKYGTAEGSYTLDSSPTYTEAGTYEVYYQVTRTGYKTVTGSKQVVISKAANPITVAAKSGLTYTGSAQTLATVSGAQGNVCYSTSAAPTSCSSAGTIPTGTNAGSYTVYYYVAGNTNYNSKSGSVKVTIAKKADAIKITAKTANYTGSAVTATFSTTSGLTPTVTYYSNSSCTTAVSGSPVNAGTYYVKATTAGNTNYNASSLGCTKAVTINTIANTLTISASSATYTYPTAGTFTVTKNTSGGTLSCTTDKSAVATCSISGTTVTVTPGTTAGAATITVKSAAKGNYNAAQVAHVATTAAGTLSVTANGYSGNYDGAAHGITVTSSGATIKYGTSSGSYTLTSSPTYTAPGTYTVYYQVTRTGYKTVTGSKQVVINKAPGAVTLSATSGSMNVGASKTFTVSGATGALTCSSSNTGVATCSISGTTVTVTGVKDGSATITINVAASTNYSATSKTYAATVNVIAPTITFTNTPTTAQNGYYKQQVATVTFNKSNLTSAYYYLKSGRAATIDNAVTQSCGTGTEPTTCSTITSTTDLAANTWYRVSTTVNVTYDVEASSTATLYASTYSGTTKKAAASATVSKIDKSSPTVTIGTVSTTGSSITIPYTLTDSSGIGSYTCKYVAGGTDPIISAGNASYSAGGSSVSATSCTLNGLKEYTKYYYQICATDKVGNSSSCKTGEATTKDVTAPSTPTITLKLNSSSGSTYTSGSWTNQNVYHIVNSSDSGSGIAYYQYSHDGSTNWSNDIGSLGWSSSYNSDRSQLGYLINWAGNWNFYIRAVDNAGNVSKNSSMFTVRIDKTAPSLSGLSNGSGGNWTTTSFSLSYKVAESGSGIAYCQYKYAYDVYGTCNNTWCKESATPNNGVFTTSFSAKRNTTAYFRCVDNAGNISNELSTPIKIGYTPYSVGNTINYNPVSKSYCSSPVSTTGTKTGCMRWYVIAASGYESSTVNVILDHNTSSGVAYTSASSKVASDASSWGSGLSPRLITAKEVATIVGHTSFNPSTASSSAWFYFDSKNQTQTVTTTGGSKYKWLFDRTKSCTSYGCSVAEGSDVGYWTSTGNASDSTLAWYVYGHGVLGSRTKTKTDVGVRPVITISK